MIQLDEIKKKSIVDVAGALGIPLKRLSSTLYEQVEHDSFKIFADTNTFKWFSRDIQGDVIDFVQLMSGRSFKEAVYFLNNGSFPEYEVKQRAFSPFRYNLPESRDIQLSRDYLKSIRHLSDETIDTFIQQGLVAQAQWRSNNISEPVIVFKSRDHRNQLVGASLQGIEEHPEEHKKGRLKKIMKDSHGYAGFHLTIGKPKRLVFLESAIDLMSYYECQKEELKDVRIISMEGLKKSVIAYHVLWLASEEKGDFTFLDGLDKGRLPQYLDIILQTTTYFQTHSDCITLAVDNDEAGRAFIEKLRNQGLPIREDLPPLENLVGKSDWNDELRRRKQEFSLNEWLYQCYPKSVTIYDKTEEVTLDL